MKKLVAVLFAVLCFLSFSACVENGIKFGNAEFSSEKWKQENNYDERYLMLDDLAEKHKLIGCNLDKVIELLGSADYEETITLETYPTQFGGKIIEYYVDSGKYSGVRESLRIIINGNYIVTSAEYATTSGQHISLY